MIETVYGSDNTENNKANKTQTAFKMPKNIRQVGKSSTTRKIYVEDYVMTFIKQLSGEDTTKCKTAVLVGQSIKAEGCRNIFIYGAAEVEGIDAANDMTFSNDTWTAIYDKIKKYFADTEIVGWYIGGPGYLFEDTDRILKAHIDNFAGQDKILLIFDNLEKDESFLVYENSHLCKQEGYYIYYEKNDEMQTYMIDHKKVQSGDSSFDDHVSKEIRTVIQNKKPVKEENKNINRLTYAAGALLAVIILVVGAAILNNYDQMKTMKKAIESLSINLEKVESAYLNNTALSSEDKEDTQAADGKDASDGSLNVEVIPGNVTPAAKEGKQSGEKELADDAAVNKDNKTASEESKDSDSDDVPITEEDASAKKGDKTSQSDSSTTPKDNTVSNENKTQAADKKVKYYTVASGDSLLGISLKLYDSVDYVSEIMKLNNLQDQDYIYIGQKLIVP